MALVGVSGDFLHGADDFFDVVALGDGECAKEDGEEKKVFLISERMTFGRIHKMEFKNGV